MAFTAGYKRNTNISGTFNAVGASTDSVLARTGDFFVSNEGGTFDATIALEAQDEDGNWNAVCALNGIGVRVFRFANARPVRVRCAVHNSGTIGYRVEPLKGNEFSQ